MKNQTIVVIGAGVGGLTVAALLAKAGYNVTVLESQTYPGGCASSFPHKGYRFESGATVAGGFQPNGPHALVADMLDIEWPVHQHDPAWVVHLPDRSVELCQDYQDIRAKFPGTDAFWDEQQRIADLAWGLSAQGLPWPPCDWRELLQLASVGLRNFPADLRLTPFALGTVLDWLKRRHLADDQAFKRFLDASLLISAQATSDHTNGLYGATALDLARQGVYHVTGGIGGIAETLVDKLQSLGGEIRYRQHVTRITVQDGRVTGVYSKTGRRSQDETFIPADFVIGNLTPWSLDSLLGDDSPRSLRKEVQRRPATQGAFVLHLGIKSDVLPQNLPDHHQIVSTWDGAMGEGRTLYVSMSPEWDKSRAPDGHRAVTISTHTAVQQWWDLLEHNPDDYYAQKQAYADRMTAQVDAIIPGFRDSIVLELPGSPVTYQFYTLRQDGMVGGFPQMSLFKARGPRTGLPNLRLVGDSIFPGQSTAGVSLGAIRVAEDVQHHLPNTRQAVYTGHTAHEGTS